MTHGIGESVQGPDLARYINMCLTLSMCVFPLKYGTSRVVKAGLMYMHLAESEVQLLWISSSQRARGEMLTEGYLIGIGSCYVIFQISRDSSRALGLWCMQHVASNRKQTVAEVTSPRKIRRRNLVVTEGISNQSAPLHTRILKRKTVLP